MPRLIAVAREMELRVVPADDEEPSARLASLLPRICIIEHGGDPLGNGFLIRPDLLLTASRI
jgi:hypothetical protein